jgi:molybdenum cofactor biosynthesis protein B
MVFSITGSTRRPCERTDRARHCKRAQRGGKCSTSNPFFCFHGRRCHCSLAGSGRYYYPAREPPAGLCNIAAVTANVHKHAAPSGAAIRIAIVTVSDTRTEETDVGGRLIHELCTAAGHTIVSKAIVKDEPAQVASAVQAIADAPEGPATAHAVLLTGGTGIARRDTTVEALAARFDKTLDGFGELFRMLSFAEIGASAMLSRAQMGIHARRIVVSLPGSPNACRLALEKLLIPELGHLLREVSR